MQRIIKSELPGCLLLSSSSASVSSSVSTSVSTSVFADDGVRNTVAKSQNVCQQKSLLLHTL